MILYKHQTLTSIEKKLWWKRNSINTSARKKTFGTYMLGFKLFSWEESIFVTALLLESLVKTRLNTLCTVSNAQHSVPSDIQMSHPQVTSKTRNTCVFLNQLWGIWISDKTMSSMVSRKLKIHHFSPLTLEKWLSYPGSDNNDANQEIMGFPDITSCQEHVRLPTPISRNSVS